MSNETAKAIWSLIESSRNLLGADGPCPSGAPDSDAPHLDRLRGLIAAGQPITLVLPGFPAKSANPRKTLGQLPDFGEVLALTRLERLCRKIDELHAPGAHLVICSDGRVFNDLVLVPDPAVDRYKHGIAQIIARHRLAHLSTFDMDEVWPNIALYDDARSLLIEQYGETLEAIHDRVATDAAQRALFNGIHRFLFEDQSALRPALSRSRVRSLTKALAYAVIQRSNAWSRLVEDRFPHALRLSIHPQPAGAAKIGIRLLPSSDCWRTPWHSAALYDGREYVLVRREHAEAMNATLVMADGLYPCFSLSSEQLPRLELA